MIELLLTLLTTLTGIDRHVDANLEAIAQERSVQIVTNFNHEGKPYDTAEIIIYFSDDSKVARRAVNGWLASSPHAAILHDKSYVNIGCGYTQANGNHYFVCELSRGIPNTSLDFEQGWFTGLGILLIIAASAVWRRRGAS